MTLFLLLITALVGSAVATTEHVRQLNTNNDIKLSKHVVVLKRHLKQEHLKTVLSQVKENHANEVMASFRAEVMNEYNSFRMFTVKDASPEALESIKNHEFVDYVKQDMKVYAVSSLRGEVGKAAATDLVEEDEDEEDDDDYNEEVEEEEDEVHTNGAPLNWGLDRIDQWRLPLDNKTYKPGKGSTKRGRDVDIFILDTGLAANHKDFSNNRGKYLYKDYYESTTSADNNDVDGHGTHCASIAAGRRAGVAPGANIYSMKVLNDAGSGSYTDIIDALDIMYSLKEDMPSRKMVASMSLGGSYYEPLNTAVDELADLGVPVVVSAGNSATDACSQSPASASNAITVASSDNTDSLSWFSNYGTCTDIIAPGSSITAACARNSDPTCTGRYQYISYSGTSMSCPHVAGIVALWMRRGYPGSTDSPSPAQIKRLLYCTAAYDKITGVSTDTPNVLLHSVTNHAANKKESCILNYT